MDVIDENNYILNVKYVIFLVSKIIFAYKLKDSNIQDISIIENEMMVFNEYSNFDLKKHDIEGQIYKLIHNNMDTIDYNNFLPATFYELLLTPKEKKSLGQVYTPDNIIVQMNSLVFNHKNIDKNMKILDPSCGGGYFLVHIFNCLKNKFSSENILVSDQYILENMIFGCDVDDFSIFMTKLSLLFNSSCMGAKLNILQKDFLTDFDNADITFDVIIGNPPYIGHKQTDKDYSKLIRGKYRDVFYNKADISYCFFKSAKNLLKQDGILCFITSRYFMEAMHANKLRNFLKNQYEIISIIDFNGIRPFKGVMISPAILTLRNSFNLFSNENTFSYVKYNTSIDETENFNFNQNKLQDSGWVILESSEEELFNRIENISNTYLGDLCSIKQGIITGMDKAFIVTEDVIQKYHIERSLLRKWVKNSNITKSNILYKNLYIIYSNLIHDERDYPNAINYLKQFKERLLNRRECKKGILKWYELQWGRIINDFENAKIVFPYKSYNNNFFYDCDEYFCSADTYIINGLRKDISFKFLQNYLNSSVFEFYFKCVAKKVGTNLYEYYPNKLNFIRLYIPDENISENISDLEEISIENFLQKVFNINEEDKKIINKYILKG